MIMFCLSRKYSLLLGICLLPSVLKADWGTYYTDFTTNLNFSSTTTQPVSVNVNGTFTVDEVGYPLYQSDFKSWDFTFTMSNFTFVLTPTNSTFQLVGNVSTVSAPGELSFVATSASDGFKMNGLANGTSVQWIFAGGNLSDTVVTINIPSAGSLSDGLFISGDEFTLPQQELGAVAPTPEPASKVLFGIGAMLVGTVSAVKMWRRRRASVLAG
jgi:hypothetical protein